MKVHILLSTYNGATFLADQIESIQAQTVTDWTLLIRDDGSSDGTHALIEAFIARDPRIRWINPDNQKNLGVVGSFFELVKHEPADFYCFSDQDDVWLPDKLQVSLEAIQSQPTEQPTLVYTDLTVVDEELQVLTPSMITKQSGHANTSLVEELTENTVTGGVALFNHALAQNWTDTEGIVMHDWYLALLAAAMGKLIYIDRPTELYRQHRGNVLGARTWYKYSKQLAAFPQAVAHYWQLIRGSQVQAKKLLSLPLTPEKRQLIEDYVSLTERPFLERIRILKRYGLKKNKWYHTLIFTSLVLTKFAYKES